MKLNYDGGVAKTVSTSALDRVVDGDKVTLGLLLPVDNDWAQTREPRQLPTLAQHTRHLIEADQAGFAAAWFRDVPSFDRNGGDAGQIYDPWSYLGYIAALTSRMVLGTAAVVTPLDHDLHLAKRAASIDQLSHGRFVFGIGTGDREAEYALFEHRFEERGQQLRDTVERLRSGWATDYWIKHTLASTPGLEAFSVQPRPAQARLPLVVVGGATQSLDWIASRCEGWFTYPKQGEQLADTVGAWHSALAYTQSEAKPLLMPFRLVLEANPDAPFKPFPMGARTGLSGFKRYLDELQGAGVAHLALNLRLNERQVSAVLEDIARDGSLL